jgi:CRISPR associated protein Cas1
MSVSNFHVLPKVPDSLAHLDPDVVVEVLSRHAINVSDAAGELGVASADLRRLLWARPQLTDTAVEFEERRLDLAEKNIYEALRSDDSRRRDAASFFVVRNSHRARKRGWITTSTSVAEFSISTGANGPREIRFRWRSDDDDKLDAEAAEAERMREGGKLIEHEAGPETFEQGLKSWRRPDKAGDSMDLCRSTTSGRARCGGVMFERAGIMHCEWDDAPAFLFDLMEPERPRVDRAVLDFVRGHVFDPADFVIRSDGVCRLNPEMARMVVARVLACNPGPPN